MGMRVGLQASPARRSTENESVVKSWASKMEVRPLRSPQTTGASSTDENSRKDPGRGGGSPMCFLSCLDSRFSILKILPTVVIPVGAAPRSNIICMSTYLCILPLVVITHPFKLRCHERGFPSPQHPRSSSRPRITAEAGVPADPSPFAPARALRPQCACAA